MSHILPYVRRSSLLSEGGHLWDLLQVLGCEAYFLQVSHSADLRLGNQGRAQN